MVYRQKLVERSVFRAYDIRGVIGKQLNEDDFYTIGRAISCRLRELKRHEIFIARDGRLTSDSLSAALKQGLLDSGITVIDLGAVATPVMYYATHTQGIDSGLMVTGSHNPADYNGIKMVLAGKTLVQADIEQLYELIVAGKFQDGQGIARSFDIIPDYINRIISDIKIHRPLKVVVDCGNGIAGPIVPKVITALGCEVIPMYCEVDGRFPNHHPDPTIETNLIDLKKAIAQHKADIGLAFDGDADRLGVVTNLEEVIWPDRLLMFYAREVLKRNKGATIVYDVKCSSHLARVIEEADGIARMCPTGHSIVKGVMKEENAALAGEMSGHLFFKDRWYGFDDALYSACRLLEILSVSEQSVSEQFAAIPNSVNTPEIKIPIAEEDKFTFMQRFSEQAKFPNANIITIDGLRVEFQHGWGLLRASNTTPCLVARFEAKDQESLKQIQILFKSELQEIDKNLVVSF
ncbi:phosphomannomutase/phosphoglucomutase [Legionella micdadei]|uniref:phosphomannomutase n=1 Tax=Legionella micdadei TaxID=451 RepID=A0A098GBU9_LEGMI|nr:phosphomannomutase/phosphoglucomutase [Legionella micdadei]ARG98353.1 phosphomannomutase/phosphoglucomutase [Legionella micdadei]ARH01106.1 phosphomannomutase/phosphoglucomutase [Legionella micdadei]KTD27286.1 phosphomannomutase [Legionella micdadei]NSL18670.1 phosphomannomutase/phosphoglucomutase [Legionella micdadei]CEG59973.1 Phosphomannomutase/phosphoglucomutase [Legionella micdadei]